MAIKLCRKFVAPEYESDAGDEGPGLFLSPNGMCHFGRSRQFSVLLHPYLD